MARAPERFIGWEGNLGFGGGPNQNLADKALRRLRHDHFNGVRYVI
jgi:hypothetical protein